MIHVVSIEIQGQSTDGPFGGILHFEPGLHVVSGRNGFGKSLASKAIAWCLNLEALFGHQDSDPSFFPAAAINRVELSPGSASSIESSHARLRIDRRQDGERLALTRGITNDRNQILIERFSAAGQPLEQFKLVTGSGSMADSAKGFQNFIFEWLSWPRMRVTTFTGSDTDVYLENLAPLFFIEQKEGWTEIQARQVRRYRQQQIREVAVEFLLGGVHAAEYRVSIQRTITSESALREKARLLGDQILKATTKRGWAIAWLSGGSLGEILSRWSDKTLEQILLHDADVDFSRDRKLANERLEKLKAQLLSQPIDPNNISSGAAASQLVIDLKAERHGLNSQLHNLRAQYLENENLLKSLEVRIQTATDVHRLKTTGIGRLGYLECPTCHRELDPASFKLAVHPADEVEAHIAALKRDRSLTQETLKALGSTARRIEAEVGGLDEKLREAQRTLQDITRIVGAEREQLVKLSATKSAEERNIERLDEAREEVAELQNEVDNWITSAKAVQTLRTESLKIEERISAFSRSLDKYLTELGHGAIKDRPMSALSIDRDQYEPYLDGQKLRLLGSASDTARLVAGYTLALAAASTEVQGLHPGVIILDEPLQQNPDPAHRELFISFLSRSVAQTTDFQTIIFTSLQEEEVSKLVAAGVSLVQVHGYFLNKNKT